jgi:sec-independent protein translocase protein TatA
MALEGLLQPTHLIIILIIAVIVFGPSKLPELGASLGKGIREFKKSTQELTEVKESVTSTVTQAVKLEPTRVAAPAPLPSQPEPRHQGPVTLPRQEIE